MSKQTNSEEKKASKKLHGQDKKICHFAFSFVFFAAKRLGDKAFLTPGYVGSYRVLTGHRKTWHQRELLFPSEFF